MAGLEVTELYGLPGRPEQRGYIITHGVSYAHALKIWQANCPVFSPAGGYCVREVKYSGERDGLTVVQRGETLRRWV